MTTQTATQPAQRAELTNPVFQAFTLLRVGFTAAPILFGLDKFFQVTARLVHLPVVRRRLCPARERR